MIVDELNRAIVGHPRCNNDFILLTFEGANLRDLRRQTDSKVTSAAVNSVVTDGAVLVLIDSGGVEDLRDRGVTVLSALICHATKSGLSLFKMPENFSCMIL